jgi:hypothetical protein
MTTYKLLNNEAGNPSGFALNVDQSRSFKISGDSREANAYKEWLAEGNTPQPAD